MNILKHLKANKKTEGVIIISAKNAIDDRIAGLNLGADDYLQTISPFRAGARVAAVIRRRKFDGNSIIQLNELNIDTAAKTVTA